MPPMPEALGSPLALCKHQELCMIYVTVPELGRQRHEAQELRSFILYYIASWRPTLARGDLLQQNA